MSEDIMKEMDEQWARRVLPRSKLIALTGPKHCGKSTIAGAVDASKHCTSCSSKGGWFEKGPTHTDYWVRCPSCVKVRHRFAGPLKAMLRTLGLTEAQVDGDEKETPCELLSGHTPRMAMVTLGTEWGRMLIGKDLWVNATMLRVDTDLAAGRLVVIDDLRFDNEALAVRARGGLIIQLERPGVVYTGEHASEVGVSGCYIDHIVPNADEPALVAQHVLQLLRKHSP